MKQNSSRISLGDLVTPVRAKIFGEKDPSRPYIGLEHIAQRQPVLLGTSPSSDSVSVNSVFEIGDILFGKLRPNLRKCIRASFAGYCSTDILVLRPRKEIDAGFAGYVLQSEAVFDAAEQTAVGTKMPRTNWDALAELRVFFPDDRSEQGLIAEILDEVVAAIRQTETLLAKQQRIKTGLLHDLLTRGLDAEGRLRDPATHPFKRTLIGELPTDWEPSTVGAECIQVCVGIVIRPTQYYADQGPIALRSMNVQSGFFDLSNVVRIREEANERLPKSRLKVGDVVTVRTGEPGTSAVVVPELEGANCIDLVISRPGRRLRPGFLALWMNSAFGTKHVFQNQGGLAQQHFNVGDMKLVPIPVPDVSEQDAIVARGHTITKVHDELQDALNKLRRLKSGLMHDLLTGTVPVTPLLSAPSKVI